jgi:hypothetical protein
MKEAAALARLRAHKLSVMGFILLIMSIDVNYSGKFKRREASQKSDVMGFCLCVSLRPAGGALRLCVEAVRLFQQE